MRSFFSISLFSILLFVIFRPTSNDSESIEYTTDTDKAVNRSHGANAGTVLDRLDGVDIYFNGGMSNTSGRNTTSDGYNLGLKWQCVEFVKRYYYEKYNHKMPDSYGHAKDFFDESIGTGWNKSRALNQYSNGGIKPPLRGDILVFGPDQTNPYGHIGVIAEVRDGNIQIAQQNWGTMTRMNLSLVEHNGQYQIDHPDVLGWLSLD